MRYPSMARNSITERVMLRDDHQPVEGQVRVEHQAHPKSEPVQLRVIGKNTWQNSKKPAAKR